MRPTKDERRSQLLLHLSEKDRDDSLTIPQGITPQPDSYQLRIGEIPVIRSRWVAPGTFLIQGDFPKPPGWADATDEERMRYAVAHGGTIFVNEKTWVQK